MVFFEYLLRSEGKVPSIRKEERVVEIPCPHRAGVVPGFSETASDYHPLTREDIAVLLKEVRLNGRECFRAVLVRLCQGIPGMVCPPPTSGPVAMRAERLRDLLAREGRKDPLPDVINRIVEITSA